MKMSLTVVQRTRRCFSSETTKWSFPHQTRLRPTSWEPLQTKDLTIYGVHIPSANKKLTTKRMMAKREITPQAETVKIDELLSGMDMGMLPMSSIQKKGNKRRFSDEQIKFLEFMFESESRPESRMKQKLANELGLQARQVAIWFQNRRARLKTKQIEKEYGILKASHDALASSFESLKRENQSLLTQLQKLKNQHIKNHGSRDCRFQTESSSDGKLENKSTDSESKEKPSLQLEGFGHIEEKPPKELYSRNMDSTIEETNILNQNEHTEGSMASSDWNSFGSNCLLDESSCSSQWWEYLS